MIKSKRTRGQEKKGKKIKDRPCKIYIFTEGETELIYLKHYENKEYRVEVIPVFTEYTDAKSIVRVAKEFIDDKNIDIGLGDRCYCVFDSDPKSNPDIKSPIDWVHAYKHKGLFCIFSNPCFEIWYVLHFRDAPFGKNAGYVKSMVKDLVKDKYPDYCETVDIFNYIFDKQAEALRRAKQLHKSHKDVHRTVYCHDCNPFTNIYEFIDYVESAKIY